MRGWSCRICNWELGEGILPAYAGVILITLCFLYSKIDSSRVCGGDPMLTRQPYLKFRFFPRMRGWSQSANNNARVSWILPAYAGVILNLSDSLIVEPNSSRVCGGDPYLFVIVLTFFRFFPRMRGWSRNSPSTKSWEVILPAYAGVILMNEVRQWCFSNSSRVCGGDPIVIIINQNDFSFFPRMRGWSFRVSEKKVKSKILPAYAGVILLQSFNLQETGNSSRVCGGDPISYNNAYNIVIFFPRMRGWSRHKMRYNKR